MSVSDLSSWNAAQDFQHLRQRAVLREALAGLTGAQTKLLSYEEVRKQLRVEGSAQRGLQSIPLEAIVGSVGRYTDFTRDFLPLRQSDKDRWVRVKVASEAMMAMPPIEVYQIGESYFVLDGNHRVSVARQLGATHIDAIVTEIKTKVPLTPTDRADDLIIKAEYANFLDSTHLDQQRPTAYLQVSIPGQYRLLEDHIQVHRYYMGLEQRREIAYPEAAAHWYDAVFLPMINVIEDYGLTKHFPHRTKTDLYLWLSEHRAAIEQEVGWEIRAETAAQDLTARHDRRDGKEKEGDKPVCCLFNDLLVPLTGTEGGWHAFEQAIVIAQREGAQVHGLHIVPTEAAKNSSQVSAMQVEFEQRCAHAGLSGKLAIIVGTVTQAIYRRTRWVDLLVVNLTYPPADRPLARLSSGLRTLMRGSSTPILTVPGYPTPFDRALLAYDGSQNAEQALYLAAYMAGKWQIPLTVVTVFGGDTPPETLMRARLYLEELGIEASYEVGRGAIPQTILLTAEAHQSNVIILGGSGSPPLKEVAFGSAVDEMLRQSRLPLLICR